MEHVSGSSSEREELRKLRLLVEDKGWSTDTLFTYIVPTTGDAYTMGLDQAIEYCGTRIATVPPELALVMLEDMKRKAEALLLDDKEGLAFQDSIRRAQGLLGGRAIAQSAEA